MVERAFPLCLLLTVACGGSPPPAEPGPAAAPGQPGPAAAEPAAEPRVVLGSYREWTRGEGAFAALTGGDWEGSETGGFGTIGHGSGSGTGRVDPAAGAGAKSRVTEGATTVRGALDKQIIRRYLRRKRNQLAHCYEQQLAADPGLAGKVDIELAIDSIGRVPNAKAKGISTAVERCIAGVIKSIIFPKPKGSMVIVAHSLTFAPAATAKVPVVGKPIATGSLTRGQIQGVIRKHKNRIKHCYEKALLKQPGLSGKVVVNFTIAPSGVVSAAKASGMTGEVDACIQRVVMRMRFPRPAGGGIVQVRYPFVFTSAGATSTQPTPPRDLDEGKMGRRDSERDVGRYAIERDLEVARSAGILGALAPACERVEPPAPVRALPERVTNCYRKAWADDPSLSGAVNVELRVGSDGAIGEVLADGAAPLVSCVKSAVEGLSLRGADDEPRTIGFSLAFDHDRAIEPDGWPVLSLVPGVVQYGERSARYRGADRGLRTLARESAERDGQLYIRIAPEVDGRVAARLLGLTVGRLQVMRDGGWQTVAGLGVGAFWRQRCASTPPAIIAQVGTDGIWLTTPRGRVEILRRGGEHDLDKLAGVLGKLRPVVGSESLIELRADHGTRFADLLPVIETVVAAGFFEPTFSRSRAPDPRSSKR